MVLPLSLSRHILRTSYPPSDANTAKAQKSLKEGSHKLNALEEEIIRLETKRSLLSLERQAFATFIENHKALLSPSNKLTDDVLQEIFYHCLPTAHPTIMSVHEPPLSLGRVCGRWRTIVYSTPKLWTSIHVIASRLLSFRRGDTARIDAISSWLSRSGALPLSISIYRPMDAITTSTWLENSQIQPYLNLILPHAHRWRNLRFHLHSVQWVDMLSQIRSTDVPLLEHVHIEDNPLGSRSRIVGLTIDSIEQVSVLARDHGILQAPLLASLTLPGYFVPGLRPHLRWKRLTHLHFSQVVFELPSIFGVLTQCHNLVTCTIDFKDISPNPWIYSGPGTSAVLPNLQKLSIMAGPGKDGFVCQILDSMTAPSLVHLSYRRKLDMWGCYYVSEASLRDEERMSRSLGGFLDKVSRPLEELDLWCEPASEKLISGILRNTPGLRRLSLQGRIFPVPRPSSGLRFSPGPYYQHWERASTLASTTIPTPNDTLLLQLIPDHNRTHSTVQESIHSTDDDDSEQTPSCLCPNLEVICLSKIYFSHGVLLDFLRSRSVNHWKHGVRPLAKVSIHIIPSYQGRLGYNEDIDLRQEVGKLEKATGLQVFLDYPAVPETLLVDVPLKRDLPYSGIRTIDQGDTPTFIPEFS